MKSVIFDFDGVLMNSLDILFDFIKLHHSEISSKELEEIFHGNAHNHPLIKNFVKNHLEELDSFFIEKTNKEHFYEGVIKFLDSIRDYQLFINSSAPSYNIKHFLSLIKKENFFKEILGFDHDKSKVKKFNLILNKYQLKKEDCIFVTDSLGDLNEAQEVGIKSIGVTWGVHDRETLEKGKSISIVNSFEELENIINDNFNKIKIQHL